MRRASSSNDKPTANVLGNNRKEKMKHLYKKRKERRGRLLDSKNKPKRLVTFKSFFMCKLTGR